MLKPFERLKPLKLGALKPLKLAAALPRDALRITPQIKNKLYFRLTKKNLLSTLINTNQIQILVSTPIKLIEKTMRNTAICFGKIMPNWQENRHDL